MKKVIATAVVASILASPFFITSAAATNYTQPQANLSVAKEVEPLVMTKRLNQAYDSIKQVVRVATRNAQFARQRRENRIPMYGGSLTPSNTLLSETYLD